MLELSENTKHAMNQQSRRSFLKTITSNAAILAAAAGTSLPAIASSNRQMNNGAQFSARDKRVLNAKLIRQRAMKAALDQEIPIHENNGEELDYPYIASFTKGMVHNELGEVDLKCWKMFAKAIESGKYEDFEKIPLSHRRLKNPLAGLCYELEGADPTLYRMKPAPRIDAPENSAEMAELYWEALCRDVPFREYENSQVINDAAGDLSKFTDLKAPKNFAGLSASQIFRGNTIGDSIGPYVSQFLYLDIPVSIPFLDGQNPIWTLEQRTQTVEAGRNYLCDYSSWLSSNNGDLPKEYPKYDPVKRYIRNGRDFANAVHQDFPWQFAIHAAYLLYNLKFPYDDGIPYSTSKYMEGFATFGYPHLMANIAEASVRAARAVWFQKWWVHRRLTESFGGRIHNHLRKAADYSMINGEILNSTVLEKIFELNAKQNGDGTYLLPQVYPEGSGLHPAYASGHAAMIGAAVTILKAWFDEDIVMPPPVVPNEDGTELEPYSREFMELTVGGELDKLASNIALARNWAGIHWRSDATQGLELGERVAIQLLKEQMLTYCEPVRFRFRRFNGTQEIINSMK
ncbi:MAG TPA: vanadium-dependent haloperoxidase [Acidobacteriota bacterium]|nr:vanadium-dependent haloperoxidase [Acidobacteriota bacterium]